MQFVPGNLDVFRECHPRTSELAGISAVLFSLGLSAMPVDRLRQETVCVLERWKMAVCNNQMKRFLLHLLHPPARSGHASWAKTNLNNFLFSFCHLLSPFLLFCALLTSDALCSVRL